MADYKKNAAYRKARQAKTKELRSKYTGLSREEKEEAVRKLKDQVRKRVERLRPIEEEYGDVPALTAIEKNRKRYDAFDAETHKIAIKDENGKTIAIKDMTDEQLDKIIEQGTDWLSTSTSTVSGAKKSIASRTESSIETIQEEMGIEIVPNFDDIVGDQKELLKIASQMSSFWKVVKEIRKAGGALADKILNPNEYSEVFQDILDVLESESGKSMTPKQVADLVADKLKEKANAYKKGRLKEEETLVKESGGSLRGSLKTNGRYKG